MSLRFYQLVTILHMHQGYSRFFYTDQIRKNLRRLWPHPHKWFHHSSPTHNKTTHSLSFCSSPTHNKTTHSLFFTCSYSLPFSKFSKTLMIIFVTRNEITGIEWWLCCISIIYLEKLAGENFYSDVDLLSFVFPNINISFFFTRQNYNLWYWFIFFCFHK